MTTDYCTADELREWLGITDGDEAGLLESAPTVASRMIDNYCSTFFYLTAAPTAREFTPDNAHALNTPPIATTSGMTVKVDYGHGGTYGTTLTLGTDYIVKPDSGYDSQGIAVAYNRIQTLPARFLPMWFRPSVEITAQWGWASVPEEVRQATLLQASRIYRRRLTPEGFSAGEAFGAIRVSSRIDPDVAMLVDPYKSFGSLVV